MNDQFEFRTVNSLDGTIHMQVIDAKSMVVLATGSGKSFEKLKRRLIAQINAQPRARV